MSAIVSSSARWVFSSSFISCFCWKRELYHSFSSLLLENGLLVQREIREKKERRKRERRRALFLPFSPLSGWSFIDFFFSRAFLFCARLKVKSDEDDEDEEEEEEDARRALDDHAVIFLWKENVSKIIFARERRRGILLFHRRRFKIHQKKRVLCDLFFGLAWLGGSFFSVSFFL
jgi:hypothetical protein